MMLMTSPEKIRPLVVHAVDEATTLNVVDPPFAMGGVADETTVGATVTLQVASVVVSAVAEVGKELIE